MPRVPTLDAFQVAPAPAAPRLVDSAMPGNAMGEQLQRAGAAVQGLGALGNKLQLDAIQEANQVRVDDAINQAKEAAQRHTFDRTAGFTALKGRDAFERPDGQGLADEYGTKLRGDLDRIEQGLASTTQREAFRRAAGGIAQQFVGNVAKHETEQFQRYTISTREGTIANRLQEIGLNYSNPGAVDEAVASISAATYDLARLTGQSAEWAQAQVRRATSNAHKVAVAAALEKNDLAYAQGYLKRYGGQMEADDLLRVQGLVTKEVVLRTGESAADAAVTEAARKMQPTQLDRVVGITLADGAAPNMTRIVGITMQSESQGQRYGKDGKLLTSPKGAKGEMQVLDGTNRDPGFGVRPAQDNSPDERARVGRDYIAAMVKRYNGDLAKAWAAYNWGAGAVDKAVAEAEKDAGQYRGAQPALAWLEKAPKETRDYVAKNLKAYGENAGAPPRPTLADVVADAQRRAGDNPDARRAAAEAATRKYNLIEKATKQREDEAVAEVQRQLIGNGGNWAALPASVRNSVPPGQVDNLLTYAQKVARKEPIETDFPLFYALRTDPVMLADKNLASLRHLLSDGDLRTLVDQQKAVREGKGDLFTTVRPLRDVLGTMMRERGIDPTPKDTDKEGAAKVGKIMSEYEQRLRAFEQRKGSVATPEEQTKLAAESLGAVEVYGWPFNKQVPRALVNSTDVLEVPEADRKFIRDALKRVGREVTPAAIENLYRQRLGLPARQ